MKHLRTHDLQSRNSRFHWVTNGHCRGPLSVFDEPVVSTADAVAVPSLGSMVPGWTLLIPRRLAASFAALEPEERSALSDLRTLIITKLSRTFAGTVYEFEHGPAHFGGVLGCGVDQAHLHLVPLEFDLLKSALSIAGDVIKLPAEVSDGWRLVPKGCDYVYVRNTKTNVGTVVLPSTPKSQAIRRIIADRLGSSEIWDYRTADGLKQAMGTKLAFERARDVAGSAL